MIDLVAMAEQILTAQFQTAQTDTQPVLDDDSDEGLEWWQK